MQTGAATPGAAVSTGAAAFAGTRRLQQQQQQSAAAPAASVQAQAAPQFPNLFEARACCPHACCALLTRRVSVRQALRGTPQLSTLFALVQAAGLDVPTLQNPATRWTVFAPTNAAFDAAFATLGTDLQTVKRAVSYTKGQLLLETHFIDNAALPAAQLAGRKSIAASNGVTLTGGACPACALLPCFLQNNLTAAPIDACVQ